MIEKQTLERCVEKGMSIADISKYVNYSKANVRHWLKKYNLKTKNLQYNRGADNKKYISLNCAKCGTQFQKRLKVYGMELKRNPDHNFYCSKECAGITHNDLSPFRRSFCAARERVRHAKVKREFDITVEDLKNLWDDKGGKCAISGLEMTEPPSGRQRKKTKDRNPLTGSLDRIDSDKGYVNGNIQWVCTFVNYAKNNYDDNEIKKIFNELRKGAK
jgi:hypothetical protein